MAALLRAGKKAGSLFATPAMREETCLLLVVWLTSALGFYSFATWAPTIITDTVGHDQAYVILTATTVSVTAN